MGWLLASTEKNSRLLIAAGSSSPQANADKHRTRATPTDAARLDETRTVAMVPPRVDGFCGRVGERGEPRNLRCRYSPLFSDLPDTGVRGGSARVGRFGRGQAARAVLLLGPPALAAVRVWCWEGRCRGRRGPS